MLDAGGGWIDVAVQLVVLGFVSLAAHGELHRGRASSHRLTLYCLVVALGVAVRPVAVLLRVAVRLVAVRDDGVAAAVRPAVRVVAVRSAVVALILSKVRCELARTFFCWSAKETRSTDFAVRRV